MRSGVSRGYALSTLNLVWSCDRTLYFRASLSYLRISALPQNWQQPCPLYQITFTGPLPDAVLHGCIHGQGDSHAENAERYRKHSVPTGVFCGPEAWRPEIALPLLVNAPCCI